MSENANLTVRPILFQRRDSSVPERAFGFFPTDEHISAEKMAEGEAFLARWDLLFIIDQDGNKIDARRNSKTWRKWRMDPKDPKLSLNDFNNTWNTNDF